MRVFGDCKTAIHEIERDLVVRGVWCHPGRMQDKETTGDANYETKELIGYSYCITETKDKFDLLDDINERYCRQEVLDRFDIDYDLNPGNSWSIKPKVWDEFRKKHKGKFAYTYHNRIRGQKAFVLEELKKHPQTRQAIISIYEPMLDAKRIGNDRIPCSMYYQFLIRNGKLDIIYTMRSTDLYTHFRNDIVMAMMMQEVYANDLGIPVGKFFHFCGSLHYYRKDEPKVGVF